MAEMLSTGQVAEKYKVETREVLYAIRRGLIEGQKVGWCWVFDPNKLPKIWPVRSRQRAGA